MEVSIPHTRCIYSNMLASQGSYNGRKPGLDKNTEMALLISLINSKLCFESKYVLRMIDAVVCNTWRAHQAVHVALPFIEKEEGNSRTAEIGKVRKKLNNSGMTLQDFTYKLAIKILVNISYKRFYNPTAAGIQGTVPESLSVAPDDLLIFGDIDALKRNKKFPVNRDRCKRFCIESKLDKLRTYKSVNICHNIDDADGSPTCALCCDSKTKRQRSTQRLCGTCKVPLCVSPIPGSNFICFHEWHTAESGCLSQCQSNAQSLLADARSRETNTAVRNSAIKASRLSGEKRKRAAQTAQEV